MGARVAVRDLDVHLRWLERLGAEPHAVEQLRALGPVALRWLGGEEAGAARLARVLPPMVWSDDLGELLVSPATARLRLVPGWLVARVEVACDETGPVSAQVIVGLGRSARGDGTEASATLDPRVPEVIAARWGDTLITAVWEAVVDVLEAATLQTSELSGRRLALAGFFADDGEIVAEVA